MSYILSMIAATCVVLVLDVLWLGYIARDMYFQSLGQYLHIESGVLTVNYYAAFIVYVAIIAGIFIFVLPTTQGQPLQAALRGALFGIITYAIYDYTNLAIIKDWPWFICFIDVLWGGFLCGTTSFVAAYTLMLLA